MDGEFVVFRCCCAACSKPVFGDQLGKYEIAVGLNKILLQLCSMVVSSLEPIVVKLCFFDFILSVSFFSTFDIFHPGTLFSKMFVVVRLLVSVARS